MKYPIILIAAIIFLTGCGSDGGDDAGTPSGVHFQGRDCLSCHNVDLAPSSHLSVAGTVYRSATSDKNNLNEVCSERLHIEIVGIGSTKDINAVNAAGFNGRGNVFALIKDFPLDDPGTYSVRIVDDNGVPMGGASSPGTHKFSGGFDPNNPTDLDKRYSCNACHREQPNNEPGTAGLLNAPGCI